MYSKYRFAVALCLFVSVVCSACAQEPAQNLDIKDAKTFADVGAYLQQEAKKQDLGNLDPKTRSAVVAKILMPAGDKLLEIAQNPLEKRSAYSMKLSAYQNQIEAGIEGAEQKLEAYLGEISEVPDARPLVDSFRFFQFHQKAMKAAPSPAGFDRFKAELITWVNRKAIPVSDIAQVGLQVAERNNVPAETFIKDLAAYVRSPQCTAFSADEKEKAAVELEGMIRLSVGSDPKLYGRTIDDKEFDWNSLRGKYVLVKFTATWCGPCKMEVPGMLEAYKKYHDKGLEIVSVYVFQREDDPVAIVKEFVAEEKLPWIILSEELTGRAKQPRQGDFYGIQGVPTMVLVDKEGKVIMSEARGRALQTRLAAIFK